MTNTTLRRLLMNTTEEELFLAPTTLDTDAFEVCAVVASLGPGTVYSTDAMT